MHLEPKRRITFDEALFAIADGTPVDWRELEGNADPGELDALRLIADIGRSYRIEDISAAERQPTLFHWGALEAESAIGQGSSGEVYRAFDPWLGRHVALKLFRPGATTGTGLDEARRLARLRNRNVLSVYGCGEHDGRCGMWSELIDGRTLAAIVVADGALTPEELLRVARDLARALDVVHAAGLVHGDVKAENVMRESGGRVVLMDFGAGGEQRLLASQRLISGTPRYLPPEVLDGAPVGPASDLYALGVLLYLLASARYPYAQTDAARLREAQRQGPPPPLRTLRPALDPELSTLIESCLALDPARRPESAHALAAKLSAMLHPPLARGVRHLPLAALAVACAALLGVAALWLWPKAEPVWDSVVKFQRVVDSVNVELAANSTLRVGDRLRMTLRSTRDAYVYVLNEDAEGNATVLFPQEAANLRNPQHGGVTLQLPGGAGSALAWEVTADSAREEFVVVDALQPLPELERALADWQRARVAGDDTRAVGAIVNAPPPVVQGEHLRKILAAIGSDPSRVRVWQYTFAHGP